MKRFILVLMSVAVFVASVVSIDAFQGVNRTGTGRSVLEIAGTQDEYRTSVTCTPVRMVRLVPLPYLRIKHMLGNEGGFRPAKTSVGSASAAAASGAAQITFRQDTTPPAARVLPLSGYAGQSIAAASFIRDIADESQTYVSFAATPDFRHLGTQDVRILVADAYGNATMLLTTLTLERNPNGPAISGVRNYTITTNAHPDYLAGVSAYDPIDGQITVTVDASGVNLLQNGTYTVIYRAADSAGNTASRQASVTVKIPIPYSPRGDAGSQTLNQLADGILSQLITNDMTNFQIISTVYNWTRRYVTYSSPASSNYYIGAEAGLRYRRGNCYTMTYTIVALLRRAGIQASWNREYEGRHAWAIVNDGANNRIVDATAGVFWLTEASQQNRVAIGGYYLYRTTASPEVGGGLIFRTEYENNVTVPFETTYELDPDPASRYPDQRVAVAGIDGQMRDQWNRAYLNGERYPEKDKMIEEAQVVTEKVDEVIYIGQIETTVTVIPAATETRQTDDPAMNDTTTAGTNGSRTVVRRALTVDPKTGLAASFGPSEEVVEPAVPHITYKYTAPPAEPSDPPPAEPSDPPSAEPSDPPPTEPSDPALVTSEIPADP